MNTVETRLRELGIELPDVAPPLANYVPSVVVDGQIFVAGQLPLIGGKLTLTGHLGRNVSVEEGAAQARLCAINIIAQLRAACGGDLGRIRRIAKVNGFVACTPEFSDHPKVINGASDLLVAVFGDAGRHARAAVGVASLPLMAAVEVDCTAVVD